MVSVRLANALVVASALGLVALWILFALEGPSVGGTAPAPPTGAAGPSVILGVGIFSALALAAAGAALRDAPLVVLLCGVISLVPVGLYTLVLPFPFRLIGILDLTFLIAGVASLRAGGREGG